MSHFLRRILLLATCAVATPTCVWAHNPDTSYVQVHISDDWIETRFTFDLDVLERIARLDVNGDGLVKREEFEAAVPAVRRFLRESVRFEINEFLADFGDYEPVDWPEEVESIPFVDRSITLVHFGFRKRIQEVPESVGLTFHVFEQLGNRHTILGTFEASPKTQYEVIFNWAEPDFLFFTEGDSSSRGRMFEFLELGVQHIFLGYDHILFLLALIVVDQFRTLLKIITAFTIAHTITLILATLDVVHLPSRLIEISIAATIMYVALENLWTKQRSHRWLLTFAFGLIHGFGFANVLRDLGLPTTGLVRCLLSFNVGVELGQIAIVAAVWPVWRIVRRQPWGGTAVKYLSIGIFLFGLAWFVDRVFALRYMP